MGKIIRNGIEFSGTSDSANNINYDNSVSGLEARTAQEAIDTLSDSLTASDNLKFQFATDGEGNYGYLKGDDTFVPFKSGFSLNACDLRTGGETNPTVISMDISGYSKMTYSTSCTSTFNNTDIQHARLLLDGNVYKNLGGTTITDEVVDISTYNTLTFSVCHAWNDVSLLINKVLLE